MTRENPYFNLFDKSQTVSPVRQTFGPVLHRVVEEIHEALPHLSADHLTALGTVSGLAGAYVASRREIGEDNTRTNVLALSLLAGGVVLDGLDGAMARHIASTDPSRPVKVTGCLVNSTSDFVKDVSVNVLKTVDANKRGDKAGEVLGYLAMITNPIARHFYWRAVSEGYDNPEIGRSLAEFFGTHVGKPPAYVVGGSFPEVQGFPVQRVLDATTAIGNIVSVINNTVRRNFPDGKTLGDKARKTGELRSKFHIFTSAATLAVAAGTYYALHRRNNIGSNI